MQHGWALRALCVRQRKTDTTRFHLHVKSEKKSGGGMEPKLIKTEIRFAVTRGERWGLGELNEGGQKVNISTCKINEHWEYSIQRDDCS